MRFILWLIIFTAMAAAAFAVASFYAYHTPQYYTEQTLTIPLQGGKATLRQLEDAGLTPPMPLMVIPMWQAQKIGALKAGEYVFPEGMSPSEIIDKIARGDIVVHKITIPEGWTSYQVRAALMAEPLLTGDLQEEIAEGSILPDTIHFRRDEARRDVLARMQKAQQIALNELWENRAPEVTLASPKEALILASIVEKETGVPEERGKIAGLFYNRLRIGMMLQSDPTVVYGIEVARNGVQIGRPLSKADLAADTPYNSYTRAGLPPTPICNPGKAAIEAVLHPETTDALYFVATGRGGHNFAASLSEHERNVSDYRKATQQPEPEPEPATKTPKVSNPAKPN